MGQVLGACLKYHTCQTPEARHPDPFDTSIGVGESARPKSPQEGAHIVHGDDPALEGRFDDFAIFICKSHATLLQRPMKL